MTGRGNFRDFERDIDDDDTLDGSEPYAGNVISVQNITNTIPAYTPPALSFSANTWENMIDPSHTFLPFVSTWREGMNLCKGLTFANKEEVKHVLTICALKEVDFSFFSSFLLYNNSISVAASQHIQCLRIDQANSS